MTVKRAIKILELYEAFLKERSSSWNQSIGRYTDPVLKETVMSIAKIIESEHRVTKAVLGELKPKKNKRARMKKGKKRT